MRDEIGEVQDSSISEAYARINLDRVRAMAARRAPPPPRTVFVRVSKAQHVGIEFGFLLEI